MRREEVLRTIAGHERELRRQFGIQSLFLFGSAARNEANETSDVDLLVEFDRPIGLLHLVATAQSLERLLGVERVDLVLRRAVLPELRDSIFEEAIDVFASPGVEAPGAAHA